MDYSHRRPGRAVLDVDGSSSLRGDARGCDGGIRQELATGMKRVTVGAGRAAHVDHRACLPDPVHGLHNVSCRCVWRFDADLRGDGQNGARPVQILRDGGRTDIRRPWHDRYWARPAAAAADPWQGSDTRTPLTQGYAATREAAMTAFAKSWRLE